MTARAASNTELPWHESVWTPISRALAQQSVAHGILVCGATGVGKRRFAERLMAALLCIERQDNGDACGECARCRQRLAGTHPDISRLRPEEAGRQIKVDQVRAFGHSLHLTPQYDTGRLGWIEPAEQLSPSAANSLLKTLEEPPGGCHIILITDRVSALMATIRSRCQLWRVPSAEPASGRAWLMSQGVDASVGDDDLMRTPLAFLSRIEVGYDELVADWDRDLIRLLEVKANPVTVAERVAKQPPTLWADWLYRRAQTLLQASLTLADAAPTGDHQAALAAAARRLGAGVIEPWCRGVVRATRLQQTNADWRLVVESLLIDLSQRIASTANR
ncbi:MAG: hypothetical protein PF501_09175 [Salinisphaera sp.]|jgi:DNA polymerase-3 subunit delta'|nr:hypothetical protein [Salinisphaera sp.]